MDPVTALGVTTNFFTLLELGLKAYSACQEIYHNGTQKSYEALHERSEDFCILFKALQSRLEAKIDMDLTVEHKIQLKEAKKAIQLSQELCEKLSELKTNKRRKTLPKFIKGVLNSRSIKSMEEQLNECKQSMAIAKTLSPDQDIGNLPLTSNYKDDLTPRITAMLEEQLKKLLRTITIQEQRTQQTFETTVPVIEPKASSTGKNIKRLREYLFFPEISRRQDQVEDAHRETFEWIFRDENNNISKDSKFVHWLQNGDGIYWIKGKAGSGKSTLMSFLVNHDKTSSTLAQWTEGKDLIITSFFFWSSGSEIQHSYEGLLRSIIYQILENNVVHNLLVQECPNTLSGMASDCSKTNPDHYRWSIKPLKNILNTLVSHVSRKITIAAFIDGLDEFKGKTADRTEILDMLEDLSKRSNIKICLSSRPENLFIAQFKNRPRLQLQDLTRGDIEVYVEDELCSRIRHTTTEHDGIVNCTDLKAKIVGKSCGVFLWVRLVVAELIVSIRNNDTISELHETLARMPEEIEDLYDRMMQKIDSKYHEQSSWLLALSTLAMESISPSSSLLDLALAHSIAEGNMELHDLRSKEASFAIGECKRIRGQLPSRTCGLLECTPSQNQEPDAYCNKRSELLDLKSSFISFPHRTAFEFILGKKDYVTSTITLFGITLPLKSVCNMLLKSEVLQLKLMPEDEHSYSHAHNTTSGSIAREFLDLAIYSEKYLQNLDFEGFETSLTKTEILLQRYERNFLSASVVFPEGVGEMQVSFSESPTINRFVRLAASQGPSHNIFKKLQYESLGRRNDLKSYLLTCAIRGREMCAKSDRKGRINLLEDLIERLVKDNTNLDRFFPLLPIPPQVKWDMVDWRSCIDELTYLSRRNWTLSGWPDYYILEPCIAMAKVIIRKHPKTFFKYRARMQWNTSDGSVIDVHVTYQASALWLFKRDFGKLGDLQSLSEAYSHDKVLSQCILSRLSASLQDVRSGSSPLNLVHNIFNHDSTLPKLIQKSYEDFSCTEVHCQETFLLSRNEFRKYIEDQFKKYTLRKGAYQEENYIK